MYTSHPKFLGILRFLSADTSLQHTRPTIQLSSTHLFHTHHYPQEVTNNLGLDAAPFTLIVVKKVCFLSLRARVDLRHPPTVIQRGSTPHLLLSRLYPPLLVFPTLILMYYNILNRTSHHFTNPQRPLSVMPQNTQPTHPSSPPLYTHQEKMEISPEASPSAPEEVLYTFKILEIDNAPTNTLSFGLIEFLDAALAQTGANIAAPTFLEYDYSPKELANRDNILRLLVRDATPQEDINYYDLAQQLLSSDLLRDHACGLLSAHPCEDKAWLDWLQGTQLLTILPPHPVPASYWARLECNKRKSSEFQTYFICPYADCPNAGQPFLTKRDVLQHLISDHHDLDPDQMTFLDPTWFQVLLKIKVGPLSRILAKPALGGSQKAESDSSGV